eukprot:CAMPEP_0176237974 /NCGR_PEP_ID=MMETSP0121_2-20121125/28126_1 /TAXON_ID=160619 /ORGANISM="Kryptoperidinium foliaceum, Strain CCMP 1326" /LENGTH=378 /DNA_ID=CAMNT_0017577435 /DNA_START=74 /DNA_END=1210 /DNA_ORIENTATION=+
MAFSTTAPRAGRRCLVSLLATVALGQQDICSSAAGEGHPLCRALKAEPMEVQGLGLLQVSKERKELQFPGLGDIINSATDAVGNVVDSVKDQAQDMAKNLTQQARQIADDVKEEARGMAGGATTTAAIIAAQTLNKTLLFVGEEADVFNKACMQAKREALTRIQAANASVNDVIAAFEEEATATVGKVLPTWQNLTKAVSVASSVATAALAGVGQRELGERISAQLNRSLAQADAYAGTLSNISKVVEGMKTAQMDKIMVRLRLVNNTLDKSLGEAKAFARIVMDAFDELTDKAASKLSSSLPGANKTLVDEAFDSVDRTARGVVRNVVDGPEELVGGIGSATTVVEASLPEEVKSSSVVAAPASLAALAVALVAFVA